MKNKITHPVLIIWFAISALFFFSFVKLPVIPYLNNYSKIDILQDIKTVKQPAIAVKKSNPVIIKGLVQTTDLFDSSLVSDYADAPSGMMRSFYKKLNALKSSKGKVRIAYFGDSFIEGDYITGELRDKLQQIYGGNGIGFIPMESVVADTYPFIQFNNNTSWTDYNFHYNPQKYPLGLMGHVFYSTGNSWSQFAAVHNKFKNIDLYTGQTPDSVGAVTLTIDKDGKEEKITANNSTYINKTVLNDGTPVSKLKLACASKNLPLYGVSIEDSTGVYIDNYGFRGNTGLLSLQIQPDVMKGFEDYFKYDLIIVHYGLNVIVHNDTNYRWFDRGMYKLIQKIRASYPGVPILLVSTSDVAYYESGQYITDPVVPILVRQQNEIAKKNKVAFWNLYYSMGGENTIANWADGDTTYAYKDYMHVNERGANRIAGIFLNKLLQSQKN